MSLTTLDDLRLAQKRLAGKVIPTPLIPCPWATRGDEVFFLKPESLQVTGAFKVRGAAYRIASLTDAERRYGVVTHSSGNHAQAFAHAARAEGVRAVVVMPDTSPAVKIEATRALGAEIVLVPPAEREARTRELIAEHGFVFVPPYDDPTVIAGQGTVGLEVVTDRADVDTILVPVSGGGLIAGVASAVKLTHPAARVIGVEPEWAADARDSLRAGERLAWPVAEVQRTVADGLRVTPVGKLPWEHIRVLVDDIVAVSEEEIREAMRVLALRARLVAEPSGAAAPAAYLFRRDELPRGRVVVAIVSGGNVDPALLAEVLGAA